MVAKITSPVTPLGQIEKINEIIDALGTGGVTIDDITITQNTNDELQTIGVIDDNSGNALKTWTGTRAQYDAITTKDPNTLYNITDDANIPLSLLETLWPVGAIYIGTMSVCPLQVLGVGTWQLKAADRVLQGAGARGSAGSTVNESLPNIKGSLNNVRTSTGGHNGVSGPFSYNSTTTWGNSVANGQDGYDGVYFDASRSSSTYQDNAPVQQDAYLVNIWERIS